MNRSAKLLIVGGLGLAIIGMVYGLWYALFDEHQTLEQMGGSLANGFAQAAERNMPGAHLALEQFGAIAGEYVREVHAHSHWITLGLVLIALGMFYERVAFPEKLRVLLAFGLLLGSALFPLGVLLQAWPVGMAGKVLSVTGSALVIISFAGITLGLLKSGDVKD